MIQQIFLALCTIGLTHGLFADELLQGYDFRQSPKEAGFTPTEASISFYFNSIRFDTAANDPREQPVATFKMYFRQKWEDQRLRFTVKPGQSAKVKIHPSDIEKVWRPDFFFRNAIAVSRFKQPNPQRLMTVNSTGSVYYVESLRATVPCTGSPEGAAQNNIVCSLIIESYSYTEEDLSFAWFEDPVQVNSDLSIPGYSLTDKLLHDCTQTYSAGTFPCLEIQFLLEED